MADVQRIELIRQKDGMIGVFIMATGDILSALPGTSYIKLGEINPKNALGRTEFEGNKSAQHVVVQ